MECLQGLALLSLFFKPAFDLLFKGLP